MMRSTLRWLGACAGLALLCGPPALADDIHYDDDPSYGSSAAERAGRGFASLAVPFLEIPGNVVRTDRQEGPAAAWTEGLARGFGMSLLRPPVGLYELATAPFPALADDPPVLSPSIRGATSRSRAKTSRLWRSVRRFARSLPPDARLDATCD